MLQMRNWAVFGAVFPSTFFAVPVFLIFLLETQDSGDAIGALLFSLVYYAPAGALLGGGQD